MPHTTVGGNAAPRLPPACRRLTLPSSGTGEKIGVVVPAIDFRVSPSQLKAIRSRNDAIQLFARLGYEAAGRPVDTAALGLHSLDRAHVIRSGRTRRSGYGLLIGE